MASQAFVQAEQEALRAQVAIPTAPAGRLNPAVRLTSTAGYLGSRILDTPFLRLGRTLEATGRSGSILDRSTSAVGGKFVSMGRAMTTASTSMAALQDRIATLSASSRVAGFLMGGLNAALIGVPLVMMAMSAKAESARTLHDMRDSLFGDPKTKDNVDTTPGQKKITAAQQYYNQVHGQYHSTGAKAGGLLTEITSGAAGLLTGFGLTQTSRDLFNEAYQGAQQFTGSADEKMPADLLTHLQDVAIGGLKGLSNKTMDIQTLNDWVDKQSDAILNDSSLNDVQKAAGLQKVAEIQNMFQEGADAIKNRAKGLADINQLTDRQMSTYADVFSLAMSTGSGTLQKFGPGLFSTLVGQGGISDLSDSGQLLAKMLGVDTRASAQGQIDPKAVRKWLPWGTDRIVGPGEAVLPPTYQKGDPYPTSIVGRQGLEPGGAPVPGMGGNLRPKPQSLRTSLATPAGAIDTMVAARKVAEEQLTQAQTAFEDAAKNNVDRAVFDQKQKDYLDKFQAFTSIENAIAQAAQDAASQADALIRGGDLQGGLKLMDDAIAALKRSLKGMPQGKERRDAETALRDVEAGRAERAAAPGIGASQLAAAQSRDPVTQAQKNADAATKSLNMMLNAPKGAFTPDQINNARTAQAQALVQVDQANEAVANAAGQLLIAQTKDPFEKSRRSLADLRRQLAVAESHGDQAAVDQLKGQIIAAQQQADDLASQAVQAHYSLLEAIATAAGHTVQAAQLGLQAAQANYEKVLKANGGNTRAPDVQNAKAAVVTARANVRDTWLQDRESDLKFNYDMGKISLQMYQQQLKDLLRRRDLTKQQRQEIQRTLHDLSSANQGMWNIGDIKTPTIYEARRFSQNQAAGLDYRARPQYVGAAQAASTATNNVTNNNQTNNFNINGADTAAVMRVIQSVVGAQTSQRNTTTTRRQ